MTGLDASALARAVRSGETSATQVVTACLARHDEVDAQVRAFATLDAEAAMSQAALLDRRIARGEDVGPLAGVPVAVKDNVDVAGEVTTAGSRGVSMAPAAADATVVRRLRAAGAVLLGRTNMDELAMGASTLTSAFGPTSHPWDARRSPGGSSGGAAAAVLSGQAPLAVGTDTGGSIREPASQCDLVGMAPSPGLVPVGGVLPFDPSCDRVGPLARTVADARLLLEVLAGSALSSVDVKHRLRIGIVRELFGAPNQPGVIACFDRSATVLEGCTHQMSEVSVPGSLQALEDYMTLTSVAALPVLEEHLVRGGAGDEVVRRHALARQMIRDLDLLTVEDRRRRLTAEVHAALDGVDLLLSPTMPTTAPVLRHVEPEELADPLADPYTDCWTVVPSLAGLPAISVPAGLSPDDGMPVGVMLTGRVGSDALLLNAAELLQSGLRSRSGAAAGAATDPE